jgi:hypothetical protein
MPAALVPGGSAVVGIIKLGAGFMCWLLAALVGHLLGWVSFSSCVR